MQDYIICSNCGQAVKKYRNPFPAVDIIIELELKSNLDRTEVPEKGIVLIKRKNRPFGWALPGGFVDYGESLEAAAIREAREETSLDVALKYQLGAYSDPARDPRFHTISVVFVATADNRPQAADDAEAVAVFDIKAIPNNMAFDHNRILKDYLRFKPLRP